MKNQNSSLSSPSPSLTAKLLNAQYHHFLNLLSYSLILCCGIIIGILLHSSLQDFSSTSSLSIKRISQLFLVTSPPPPLPPPPPPMLYPPVSSTPSYSSGMVHGGMQYQEPFVSTPQQAPLPTPPSNNYAMYSQGSHQTVSQPMRQQYQPEAPMLNQNYIPVPGAENPGLHGYQGYRQGNYYGLTNNQGNKPNPSQSQTTMPPPANMTNLDPSSQAQQQLQPLLPGGGEGTSNGEIDKNQRYQSTLQFAANLLQQIQQQQQLPSNASTGQGP